MTSTRKISPRLAEHPTVRKMMAHRSEPPGVIDADWLRQICLEAGADDVAFASVDDPALASEVEHVDGALPGTRSYISLVVKMNRDNVRSPARAASPTRNSIAAARSSTRPRTGSLEPCRTPATAH